jgi:hypothetical protein
MRADVGRVRLDFCANKKAGSRDPAFWENHVTGEMSVYLPLGAIASFAAFATRNFTTVLALI